MDINLQNKEWKLFEIGELFDVCTGGDIIISRITKGDIPVISHSLSNNGIADWTAEIQGLTLFDKNTTISLADRGNFHAYVQKRNFYIGTRVKALVSKFEWANQSVLSFICNTINKQSVRFSYGNNATSGVERIIIFLPSDSQGNPDYAFMEEYMKQMEQEKLEKYGEFISKRLEELQDAKEVESLEGKEWKEFFINEIFPEIQRGKRLKKANHKKGQTPYVSSTAMNNGVDCFIGNETGIRIFSDCLTLANSGSVGATFYQPFPFIASDHVTKLGNKSFNPFVYKFISTIVERLADKYSFNREINNRRIEREKVMLPVNQKGEPDYEYMENFVKNVELRSLNRYQKNKYKDGQNEEHEQSRGNT